MSDSVVKEVIFKNLKNKQIILVNSQSNQPIYEREMSAIGQNDDQLLESPVFDH
jgi:hypothetical protein